MMTKHLSILPLNITHTYYIPSLLPLSITHTHYLHAQVLLARFLTRQDMLRTRMDGVLDWCLATVRSSTLEGRRYPRVARAHHTFNSEFSVRVPPKRSWLRDAGWHKPDGCSAYVFSKDAQRIEK